MTEPVVPAPKLDLAAASDLAGQLRARDEAEIIVDMSDVTHLGALCLQVFVSAGKSAVESGRTITLTNVADRVVDQMRVMGMTPETVARGHQ